jgi:hypothetical protein
MEAREPRGAFLVGLAVVALSLLPYVVGWLVDTEDQRFGGFFFDLDDSHSYLAAMRLGMRGEWLFVSLYTPEPQEGAFMHTLYLLLGHLARLTRLPLLAVYHFARAACGLLLLLVAHRFARFFLPGRTTRWTAFLLLALSAGIGWLTELLRPTAPGGVSPLDFWLVDGYTFLAILTFPHFSLAGAALLVALMGTLSYWKRPQPGSLVIGGAAALVASAVHPTLGLTMGSVLAAYGVVLWAIERRFPWRWAVGALPLVLASGSVGLYLLHALSSDPVLAWYGQGVMLSPPLYRYVAGYGLLLLLALMGAYDVIRRRDKVAVLLVCWVVVSFSLAYAPVSMQRRMVEGVHFPLALLAALGLHRCLLPRLAGSRALRALARIGYPRRRALWLARAGLITLTWLSALYLVGSACVAAVSLRAELFRSGDELASFAWLRDNASWRDTVLASYETGNLVPAWTGHRVLLGHWAETLDSAERCEQVRAFFQESTEDEWRIALLRQHQIAYVFYGWRERELGGFEPAAAAWLEQAFRSGDVEIYRVVVQG